MDKKSVPLERAMKKTKKTEAIAKRPTQPTAIATSADVERVKAAVETYVKAAKATNTVSAYGDARLHFEAWCLRFNLSAWPATPETIVAYLSDCAADGSAWNTIALRRAAIGVQHRLALNVNPPPTSDVRVREVMKGIRKKSAPPRQRAPLTVDMLPMVLAGISTWPLIERDRARAILLLGVATALRGEQLAALRTPDVHEFDEGLSIRIHREKTDQLGKGRFVQVPRIDGPLCPVAAFMEWMADIPSNALGPIFPTLRRGGHVSTRAITRKDVHRIVKDAVAAGGFDPADFGAHSLRSGFVTAARARGMDWGEIMRQTGHKRIETAMKYERPVEGDAATFERLATMWKPPEPR